MSSVQWCVFNANEYKICEYFRVHFFFLSSVYLLCGKNFEFNDDNITIFGILHIAWRAYRFDLVWVGSVRCAFSLCFFFLGLSPNALFLFIFGEKFRFSFRMISITQLNVRQIIEIGHVSCSVLKSISNQNSLSMHILSVDVGGVFFASLSNIRITFITHNPSSGFHLNKNVR